MSERKPEDTICPILSLAKLLSVEFGYYAKSIPAPKGVIPNISEDSLMATCLGPKCQMYSTGVRGCGLRSR